MKSCFLSLILALAWSLPAAEVPRLPDVKPPGNAVVEKSIERGVYFLLGNQNKDGSWGTPRNTKGLNIYAPTYHSHYAFRLAVTALCTSALIEAGGDTPQVRAAIQDSEAYLLEHLPKLRRATADAMYNVWAHGYGLQALVRLRARAQQANEAAKVKRIEQVIATQFDRLTRYESVDGGWGYYDFRLGTQKPASSSISFVNGTVLVAFHEAKQAGLEPPPHLVKRALAAARGNICRMGVFVRRISQEWSAARHQPAGGESGPIAGVQSGTAFMGGSANHRSGDGGLAGSFVCAQ